MRILVAEDDRVSALVLRRALERLGHEPVVEVSGTDAWARFQAEPFPVVISDWMMPGMDGLALCSRIRAAGLPAYTYIVLLTARTQREDRLAALEARVDDFLTKPLDIPELAARITVAERILGWQQELQAANDALVDKGRALAEQATYLDRMWRESQYLASHDTLTGVLSRRAWFDGAATTMPTALAVFDVDYFKKINDEHGHPLGDLVLYEVAHRIEDAIGDYGVVGRIGGEEFGVYFWVPVAEAERLARAAVLAVQATPVRAVGDLAIPVSVSAGLAGCEPAALGEDALQRTYSRADRALYEAKATGRRRLVTHRSAA